MNVETLVRMLLRMFMRKGMRHMSKSLGNKQDPRLKNAKRAMKVSRRVGRM